MNDFLNYIFNGANAVPTALLLFVVLYWIIVILGVVGTDFLDFDLEVDAEVDADVEIEGEGLEVSWFNNVLQFFNLGKIPFMVWLSFLALPVWFITININALLGFESFLAGLIVFLPSLFGGLFLAKILTWPFVKVFEKLDEDEKPKEIIGRTGIVTSAASDKSRGMAEINYSGTFLRMMIRCHEGQSVKKGDEVLFIRKLNTQGEYLVEPYTSID